LNRFKRGIGEEHYYILKGRVVLRESKPAKKEFIDIAKNIKETS